MATDAVVCLWTFAGSPEPGNTAGGRCFIGTFDGPTPRVWHLGCRGGADKITSATDSDGDQDVAQANDQALGHYFGWAIIDLAPDPILVADDTGRIVLANQKAEQTFGHKRTDMVGQRIQDLVPFRPDRFEHASTDAEPADGGTVGLGAALIGIHADGSEFPIEVTLSPLVTNAGTYTVMIIRDRTRQHSDERVFRDRMLMEDQERIAAELSTSVIYTIHTIALRIANLVAEVDRPASDELHRVMSDLDDAVAAIRDTVFSIGTD